MRKVVILTGPNGAGISSARYVFEELGYYIFENIPAVLSGELFDTLEKEKPALNNILLITSIREAKKVYKTAKQNQNYDVILAVITCNKDELLKRYSLTRHIHPLTIINNVSLEKAIDQDLELADALSEDASILINTTNLELKSLRAQLFAILTNNTNKITVTFISFGLKFGPPRGLDTFFDVRALPNPFWVEELKELTGADQKIKDFLLSDPITMKLINKIINYLDFYLPLLSVKERKNYTIGICCSGGQHRSTFVANYLAEHYKDKYTTFVIHRDTPNINSHGE